MVKKGEQNNIATTKKENQEIKKDVANSIKDKILNDLTKEINTTIIKETTKFKENFKEEISVEIQNEVANMVKQEEKRILRGKNYSIFKRNFIIFLLLGIVCYFAYCLYDVRYFDFMKSECERNGTCIMQVGNNEDGTNKPQEIIKDKDWYIENYGYLLDEAKVNVNADNASAYYLYSGDYKVSEIKPAYLLNLAYNSLDSKMVKTNSQSISVEGEDLKKAFEILFGSTTNYKEVSFSYNCLNFIYNKDKNRYVAENTKCLKSKNEILEVIDNMYEEGDILYILTTATIYNTSESAYYTFDNLYEPIVIDVTKDDVNQNTKKLNKYQYQFKKANDTYYFDGITKLK